MTVLLTPSLVSQLASELASNDSVIITALCRRLDPENKGIVLSSDEIIDASFSGVTRIVRREGAVGLIHVPRLSTDETWERVK